MPDTVFDFTDSELATIRKLHARELSRYHFGAGRLGLRLRPDRGRSVVVYNYVYSVLLSRPPATSNAAYDDLVTW